MQRRMETVRHGDFLLVPSKIPSNALLENDVAIRFSGETGSNHTVSGQVYKLKDRQFIRLQHSTAIFHEVHTPRLVPPGDYEALRVRNYDPPRRVQSPPRRSD